MNQHKNELSFDDHEDIEDNPLKDRLRQIDKAIHQEIERIKMMLRKLGMNTKARKPYMPTKDRAYMFKVPKKLKAEEDLRMTTEWLSETGLFAEASLYAEILRRHEYGYDTLCEPPLENAQL